MSSNDHSIDLIIDHINDCLREHPPESILWVADEHPIKEQHFLRLSDKGIHFASNRIEPFRLAQQAGLMAEFSDFCFAKHPSNLQHLFFRVAKERALVHHIINQAFECLGVGGQLWLVGHKNEGIKTHIKRTEKLFGSRAQVQKGKNQLSIAPITKMASPGERLDDQQYPTLRKVMAEDGLEFWSKPGIYGWDKVDPGSSLLCETLAEYLPNVDHADKHAFLDLGCGYGYLSIFLARFKPGLLVATDNCATALEAAKKNLDQIEHDQIQASDAGDCIDTTFDLIVCNPPFHQGFATNSDLHKKFLSNTKRLMKPGGQAWYVVNQFLPLEKHCQDLSLSYQEISRNNSFKVLRIQS